MQGASNTGDIQLTASAGKETDPSTDPSGFNTNWLDTENDIDDVIPKSSFDLEGNELDDEKARSSSIHFHKSSKWTWLHAAYHCLVTIVGTGILGFPFATAFLGFAGSVVLITVVTAASYYTAILLTNLQEPHHGTYSEIANDVMGRPNFANRWIRPFQFFAFFPTAAVMILIGGEAMATMDRMNNGDSPVLGTRIWTAIMGCFILVLSMAPDLNHLWQISAMGCVAVLMITVYCIAGPSVALADDGIVQTFGRPENETGSAYSFSVMASIGGIIFGYGFHSVLPDIQASLHEKSSSGAHEDMKKAITSVFFYSYPAYILVAVLGYAAFGSSVRPDLLRSITDILPEAAMFVIWAFVIVKTASEGTVYNQAAFTMVRDTLGLSVEEDHADHHPKSWTIDIVLRIVWVVAATAVAVFVPYFSDLTSITAALSITPNSFILPIVLWNKKHGHEAPRWRIRCHYVFMLVWILLGVAALIGAVEDIVRRSK